MSDPSLVAAFARLLPSLALVLCALWLARWWFGRGRVSPGLPLRVIGRAGLTKNAAVAVVTIDERRFLLGAGEQGVTLLAELDVQPSPSPGHARGHSRGHSRGLCPDFHENAPPAKSGLPPAPGLALVLDGPLDAGSPGGSPGDTPGGTRGGRWRGIDPLRMSLVRPRIGLLDRLRSRTVRTPVPSRGEAVHVRHAP